MPPECFVSLDEENLLYCRLLRRLVLGGQRTLVGLSINTTILTYLPILPGLSQRTSNGNICGTETQAN